MTLTVETDLTVEDAFTPGNVLTRRTFKWRPAEKDREGGLNMPRRIAVTSEKRRHELIWMKVEDEGLIEPQAPDTDLLAIAIGSLVQRDGGEVSTATIAGGVGKPPQDRTFQRALKASVEREFTLKKRQGVYSAGPSSVIDDE